MNESMRVDLEDEPLVARARRRSLDDDRVRSPRSRASTRARGDAANE
jgi:hypothetical protein